MVSYIANETSLGGAKAIDASGVLPSCFHFNLAQSCNRHPEYKYQNPHLCKNTSIEALSLPYSNTQPLEPPPKSLPISPQPPGRKMAALLPHSNAMHTHVRPSGGRLAFKPSSVVPGRCGMKEQSRALRCCVVWCEERASLWTCHEQPFAGQDVAVQHGLFVVVIQWGCARGLSATMQRRSLCTHRRTQTHITRQAPPQRCHSSAPPCHRGAAAAAKAAPAAPCVGHRRRL